MLKGNSFFHNTVNLELLAGTEAGSKAVGGGGCVSVLYDRDVFGSRVSIDGNVFQGCSVHLSGVQHGNAYGGAVSLYFGLFAASSLELRNATVLFNSNACRDSRIAVRVKNVRSGGSAYGGCLSVYAGAWSVATDSSVVGPVHVDGLHVTISGNDISNCSAFSSAVAGTISAYGFNTYGGGVSLYIGSYSYSSSIRSEFGGSSVSGDTSVSSSSYTISNNTLTNCAASSFLTVSAVGANSYGGGISLVVGAYSYSSSGSSTVSGDTSVSNSSYTISSNTLTNCTALSSAKIFSPGVYSYGGGILIAVGTFTYSALSSSSIFGNISVNNNSHTLSSNTLINCTAASSVESNSFGINSYGGGISLVVGAYSYSMIKISSVSGDTSVSNSSYTISSNTLTNCAASSSTMGASYGSNSYGGGMSFVVGAYSYSSGSSSTVFRRYLSQQQQLHHLKEHVDQLHCGFIHNGRIIRC
jgi:hypothetical protein